MLSAGTGRAERVDAQILGVERELHLFRFRHHRNCDGGGVNAALCLGFRNTLNPMHAAFKFQFAEYAAAFHRQDEFLHTAQLGLVEADHIGPPAVFGGIHGIHPPQTVGKQGSFLPAGTGPDLQNAAFFVVQILRQKQKTQF